MKTHWTVALAVATFLPTLAPVQALPLITAPAATSSDLIEVGHRGRSVVEWNRNHLKRSYRHHGRHHYSGHRWKHRRYHHRRHDNDVGAIIGGLAAGAIIGGLLSHQGSHVSGRSAHVDWCYDRYRSYRAYDNTFQPYNGPRRQCRSPYY